MKRIFPLYFTIFIGTGIFFTALSSPEKEFLTQKEIAKIQDAQEIDLRIKIYMGAAALRLKAAEERLTGKEPEEGDPLELFTPEDMLDGYCRILKSVMYSLDDAFQKPGPDRERVGKALKVLKGSTEEMLKELEVLKKIAEEKRKEELWDLANKAIDITNGAHEGAEYGLSKQPEPPDKKAKGK